MASTREGDSQSYFSRAASHYRARSGRGLWYIVRSLEWRGVDPFFRLEDGGLALDFGSGAGFYLEKLQQRGISSFGVDRNPRMVAAAQLAGLDARLGDEDSLNSWPDSKQGFSLIIAAGVFEFNEEPKTLLSKLHRSLRANGRLVIIFPSRGFTGWLYDLVHWLWGCPSVPIQGKLIEDHWIEVGGTIVGRKLLSPISRLLVLEKNLASVRGL
jgi:SAM-dependent methyltransferase